MIKFEITQMHLPEDIRWLCEIVGIELFMEIVDCAGGGIVYIPMRQTLEQPLKRQAILSEWQGDNLKPLARKYGMSERRVREIVRKKGA